MHRRLFKVRKHLGLTQKQVADILGIGQNAYSMIESGKITLTERNRAILAEKLYINPVFLLEDRGEMLLSTRMNDPVTSIAKSLANGNQNQQTIGVPYYSKSITDLQDSSLCEIAQAEADYWIDFAP
ncbi:MAG: helix-turn-helix transcriptional regulator, partial [Mucinivorans sp.]